MTEKETLKKTFLTWLSKFEQMDHWDDEDDVMDEMRKASERRKVLSHATDDADRSLQYHNAAHELLRIQNEIEKEYLLPKESDFRWQ